MNALYWMASGWVLGFLLGLGCAFAVMYSIYLGGYRAAVRDSRRDPQPERLKRVLAKLEQ